MKNDQALKVAIVCDWLTGLGGAERVVFELHKLFPDAPIYTSQFNPEALDWLKGVDVRTGWLQKLPKSFKKFLPVLRAWSFSHLDLSAYDLVISSSGAEAKAVKTGPNTTHICYCHSPTQYYWIRYNEYLAHPGFAPGLNWLARLGLKVLVGPMKRWDFRAAQRPNFMIANSTYTQSMIKKYYGRESTVIHPPVEIERFAVKQEAPRRGFVTAGRQTPYKRIDLAVAACTQLKLPLAVIGNGPDHEKLLKLAGPTISFYDNVSDQQIASYFQQAAAFILPTNIEDFGVTAVEALAAGTPVIAYNQGGPRDYVIPGQTGEFFAEQTVDSLVQTLSTFNPEIYNNQKISDYATQFSTQSFEANIQKLVSDLINHE